MERIERIARARRLVAAVIALLFTPTTVFAYSLLPLMAETAATMPSGTAEATLGLSYSKDMRWPAFTPSAALKHQHLLQAPQIGFRIGAGDWAEIQATFETIYLHEDTASGDSHSHFGSGDARLATKVYVLRERPLLPAFGVHFGSKLPNANREDRLGTDETDFWIAGLASKDFGFLDAHANLGVLLLGNPGPSLGDSFGSGGQDDLFTYVLAATSKPLGQADDSTFTFRLLGEVTGWAGTHFYNDRANGRLGIQLQHGAGTYFLGTSFGFVTASENFGASIGYVYRFEAADLLPD